MECLDFIGLPGKRQILERGIFKYHGGICLTQKLHALKRIEALSVQPRSKSRILGLSAALQAKASP